MRPANSGFIEIVDPTNMEPAIRYFESAINTENFMEHATLLVDLNNPFLVIQRKKETVLDRQQFDRLHQVVTKLLEKTGYESMFSHRVLMDYRGRHPELDGEAPCPDEESKT